MYKHLTLGLSALALIISFLALYFPRWQRGTVEMTQPPDIYMQPGDGRVYASTIIFPALIHATADRGVYVESLDVRLQREESIQNFTESAYEDHGVLRPAAFWADRQGLGANFHFSSPGYGAWYPFLPGDYMLRVSARIANGTERLIREIHFSITPELFRAMRKQNKGIYFVWSPDGQCYIGHVGPTSAKSILLKTNGQIL